MSTQKNEPRALALGVSCYVIWGFFPLYFSLLSPAGAVEVIVHRAVWGLFFCVVALAVTGSLGRIRALIADRGALWRLAVAGGLVVINWSVYVYAVLAGHTTDAAVGYFINPLVTIALGLIVLHERVTPIQKVALALGVVAVVILVIGQRAVPIVSLTLALSFGLYSLVKRTWPHASTRSRAWRSRRPRSHPCCWATTRTSRPRPPRPSTRSPPPTRLGPPGWFTWRSWWVRGR